MDIGGIVVDLNIVEAEGLSGLRSSRDSGRNTSQNPTLGLGEDKGLAVVNGMYIIMSFLDNLLFARRNGQA